MNVVAITTKSTDAESTAVTNDVSNYAHMYQMTEQDIYIRNSQDRTIILILAVIIYIDN